MTDKTQGFWSSIPGILTGIAAVLTAFTGLYHVMNGGSSTAKPDLPVTGEPSPSPSPPIDNDGSMVHQGSGSTTKPVEQQVREKVPFPETGPLVDCTLFPTVNNVTSLMSWSNYYHQQIITADGVKRRASDPCNQAIDQRGMAHCKAPDNLEVRQALLETLTLCRAAGVEWQDIQHSTILGKE